MDITTLRGTVHALDIRLQGRVGDRKSAGVGEDLPSGDDLVDDRLRDAAEPDRGAIDLWLPKTPRIPQPSEPSSGAMGVPCHGLSHWRASCRCSVPDHARIRSSAVTSVAPCSSAVAVMKRSAGSGWKSSR